MDGGADAVVGRAPADVAIHRLIDVFVSRLGNLRQKADGGHNLTRLAKPALRNIEFYPSRLNGRGDVAGDAFDCRYVTSLDVARLNLTGADRFAVQVDCTSSTECGSASEFRARKFQIIANDPEQWRFGIDVDDRLVAVQRKGRRHAKTPDHSRPNMTQKVNKYACLPSRQRHIGTLFL